MCELAANGYSCIYGHARQGMTTPYFSENWWRAIDVIVETCLECRIKFAIWDEDCYPSPCAGNRIVQNHPEYAAQTLDFLIADAEGGKHCYLELKDIALLRCFAVSGTEISDITEYCGTICSGLKLLFLMPQVITPVFKLFNPPRIGSIVRAQEAMLF